MEAYVVGAGTDYRMGTVNPGIGEPVRAPQGHAGDATASWSSSAQATGYRAAGADGPLTLSPGDVVDFIIATNLIGTRATVRP